LLLGAEYNKVTVVSKCP